MDIVYTVLWAFATLWVAILIHESGHYLAGVAVGVPPKNMAIRLERPPHIALRSGDDWHAPGDPAYGGAFRGHAPSAFAAWLFVAGGFIVETLAALLAGYLLRDARHIALVILITSTALFVVYVVGDWIASALKKEPYGDVGSLWTIQPVATVLFLLVVLALRAAAILYA